MNILSADLKRSLKKLTSAKTESYIIGPHGILASDSDVWIVVESPLSALGSFSVSGKKLSGVVSRMSGEITVSLGEKSLELKSAKARVELEINQVKPINLPKVPDKLATIKLPEFKKALATAVASASPAKSAAFGGVVQLQTLPLGLEETAPMGYRIVGTDSIVLTVVTQNQILPFEFKTLINLTAAAVIQIMDGDEIEIGESNTHVYLHSGDTTVFASKPVQAYPSFDPLLALPPKMKFGFSPENWLEAFRTIEPLIDSSIDGTDQEAVSVQMSNGVVQWSNIGIGSKAEDESEYEQLDPDPVFEPVSVSNLKINAKYLGQFLNKATGAATMGLIAKDKPIRLEYGGVVVLSMPVAGGKSK